MCNASCDGCSECQDGPSVCPECRADIEVENHRANCSRDARPSFEVDIRTGKVTEVRE